MLAIAWLAVLYQRSDCDGEKMTIFQRIDFCVLVLCLLYMWCCCVDGTWIYRDVAMTFAPTWATDQTMYLIDCHDK